MVEESKLQAMTFDEAMDLLEKKIEELENGKDLSDEESQKIYNEGMKIRDYCQGLLDKEREEIEKMAKEAGVNLDELEKEGNQEGN